MPRGNYSLQQIFFDFSDSLGLPGQKSPASAALLALARGKSIRAAGGSGLDAIPV
jgi:hypothetical protein